MHPHLSDLALIRVDAARLIRLKELMRPQPRAYPLRQHHIELRSIELITVVGHL
jgi:hypothetical protein